MKRVIFFHVPKCAGTTVYEHLERQMGRTRFERALRRRTSILMHTKHHATQLTKMIKTAAKARLVYGHLDWNTYLRMKPSEHDFKFTFLREPVDRLRSSYNYYCSDQGWEYSNLSGNPADYSFENYLTAYGPYDRWTVDNVAVRMFSGDMDCNAISDRDWQELLQLAKARIDQLDFIGFQENLNSDFDTLCNKIGISSENVGRKRATRQARAVEEDMSLSKEIAKCVKWDRQLYEFAKSRFENTATKNSA